MRKLWGTILTSILLASVVVATTQAGQFGGKTQIAPAARAKMQTLAVGNRGIAPTLVTACTALPPEGAGLPWDGPAAGLANHHGFTLLELIVVVAIMALATAGVSLALRDPNATALEREAERLGAVLEAGRSQSRATGLQVRWQTTPQGYVLMMPSGNTEKAVGNPTIWLNPNVVASSNAPVVLGPEPIIAAQSISLSLQSRSLVIATDGLRPFALQGNDAATSR